MGLGQLKFLNAFNAIPGVGAATLREIKARFGSFEKAWAANDHALQDAAGNSQARAALIERKRTIDPDREIQKLVKENVWTITDDEEFYPPLLHQIPYPPLILYGRGSKEMFQAKLAQRSKLSLKQNTCVAVVGTRRPTPYGLEAAEAITGGLAEAGVTIVSGLATGIDAKAHAATLGHKGTTIAVLGSGADHVSIFPPENRGLSQRIIDSGGAVISEYAPGTPAVKEHFPMRNRIISGLSHGTLVVEAREKSGALITARLALEQNREVFAVPGSIFSPTSAGPNKLIQEGAKAITKAADILEDLGIDYEAAARENAVQSLDEKEKALLDLLAEPLGIDAIKTKTGFPVPVIMASLSMLELRKLVRNLGADTFQKI